MIQHGQKKTYPAGTLIFAQGEYGDTAFLIERGRVGVFRTDDGEERRIAALGPGEIFGEMSIIDNSPRSASVRTQSATEVIVISRDYFQSKMMGSDPLLRLFLQVLLKRVRPADSARQMGDWCALPKSQDPTQQTQEFRHQLRLHQELRSAMEEAQFELFFQPIVSIASGAIAGFEALLRWRHPKRGLIRPDHFIPALEETGMIVPVGDWVFHQALSALKRFQGLTPDQEALYMSINISYRQFFDERLVDRVAEAVQTLGVDPGRVTAELTESLFISDPEAAADFLERLRQIGVRIAVDDFGTGYASLTYLHRFPIDTLKIDQAFVRTMEQDAKSRVIVDTLAEMAGKLGMDVVAEGVEELHHFALLRQLGCSKGQGYHFSRPLPQPEAEALLRSGRRWATGGAA